MNADLAYILNGTLHGAVSLLVGLVLPLYFIWTVLGSLDTRISCLSRE